MPCLAIVCISTANKLVPGENGGRVGVWGLNAGIMSNAPTSNTLLTKHLFLLKTPPCPLIFILQTGNCHVIIWSSCQNWAFGTCKPKVDLACWLKQAKASGKELQKGKIKRKSRSMGKLRQYQNSNLCCSSSWSESNMLLNNSMAVEQAGNKYEM